MTSWTEGRTALLWLFAAAAISCTPLRGEGSRTKRGVAGARAITQDRDLMTNGERGSDDAGDDAGGPSGRTGEGGSGGSAQEGSAGTRAGGVAPSTAGNGDSSAPPFSCVGVDNCSTFEQPVELEADGHSYWNGFWCPPGDCLGRIQPEPDATGSSNHVFLSSLSEPAGPMNPARQLGTALNSDALGRHPFSQVAIEFDYWPFTPVDSALISWFSISNGERQFLTFVTTGSRTYVDYSLQGTWNAALQSPPPGTKVHVRIEIRRTDAQNCMLAVSYGGPDQPAVFSHSLVMPAEQSMEAQPYDAYLGLWVPDDSMTHMVSASYDNFVATWTAWDGS
jgi:hypothetical protein